MKRISWIPTALSLIVLTASCNNSADGDAAKAADSANEAKTDTTSQAATPTILVDEKTSAFMVKIADAGLTEVQLGQMAQEKAKNKSVKDFGAMMVKDHSAANDELKGIATRKNVTLPAVPGEAHQKEITDLTQSTKFDKEYIDAMVKGHKDVVDELEKASKDVTDGDVKVFIDKTLPVVRAHLDEVKKIQKTLK
jgi:putative membrane protein